METRLAAVTGCILNEALTNQVGSRLAASVKQFVEFKCVP